MAVLKLAVKVYIFSGYVILLKQLKESHPVSDPDQACGEQQCKGAPKSLHLFVYP